MLVVTPTEFRWATGGISIKKMGDVELAEYLRQAQDLAATYLNIESLSYRTVHEDRIWLGESFKRHLMQAPIRIIRKYSIITGAYGGADIVFDINDSPVLATAGPAVLPNTFGGVRINRTTNSVDASAFALTLGIIASLDSFSEVTQEFVYTAGWDDGTVQADGFTMPYPDWLKTAVRIIATDLMGDWETARRGMTGLQQLRVADVVFRKPTSRSKDEIVIPLKAKAIIDRHTGMWVA